MTSVPPRCSPLSAATPTHTLRRLIASDVGAPPVGMLAVTRSRWGSIRETLPEYWSAAQTAVAVAARAVGPLATGIVAVTRRLAGLTRETVESRLFAIHSEPASKM